MNGKWKMPLAGAVLMGFLMMAAQINGAMEHHWQVHKRARQDKMGGVPDKVLERQSEEKVNPPSIEAAIAVALEAAEEEAGKLIDERIHEGKKHIVPDEFTTIQGAIDAAQSGDVVVVRKGIYFEQLVMKDGVRLVSDTGSGGDDLVSVKDARLKLPRRTLRTIIDGSKAKPSKRGMIDFDAGLGRNTVVDGFTIQNFPLQDHHIPGHAHALNLRGASPVIMNCYLRKNGSTGIGSHVVFKDQESAMPRRDFRWANVIHKAEGVLYHNVIRESVGLGIGCNHFSAPHILGNEMFLNEDAEPGEQPSPGLGVKHGAAPIIVGNIVHDNPGGGILCKAGVPQGAHHIDRPTHPTVSRNVVYGNGENRPGISSDGSGSKEMPVRFLNNFIYDAGAVGIGVMGSSVAVVEGNVVSGSGSPGIMISRSLILKLNGNQVTGAQAPGFLIVKGAMIMEMVGNAADSNMGPRFMVRRSIITEPGE